MNHTLCVKVFDLLFTDVILHKLLVAGLKALAALRAESSTQQSFPEFCSVEHDGFIIGQLTPLESLPNSSPASLAEVPLLPLLNS